VLDEGAWRNHLAEKILIVEDEGNIARTLRLYLEQAKYQVVTISDGALAMPAFRKEKPSLVILDLMLPNVDGLEVCRKIRSESITPIIMLTARSEEVDKLLGLEIGADDYITKPFSPREVVARVKVILRRSSGGFTSSTTLRSGEIVLDLDGHRALMSGDNLELTPMEFQILAAMMRMPGRVFTRMQLLEEIEGEAYEGYERAIDQHVKNLRLKLGESARDPRYIHTVFGVGYRFRYEDETDA